MKKVSAKAGERSLEVNGDVVKVVHTTLHKASNQHYVLTTSFDYTGINRETLLRIATETLLIRWRTAFKGAETVDETADNQVVNVQKMLKGSRPRMSKADRATKVLADMSVDEKRLVALQLAKELGIEVVIPGDEDESEE